MNSSPLPAHDACVVACVTRDRLADAVVLIDSIRRYDAVPVMLAVLGDDGTASRHLPSDTTVLNERDLALPDLQRFLFQYTGFELCCAIKPWLILRALTHGFQRVLYLDSDIQVYDALSAVFDKLSEVDVVLTPHWRGSRTAGVETVGAHMHEFRPSGLFNAGFIGVANTAQGRDFVAWWQDRCRFGSIVDQSGGLFVDQGWLDFAPLFFKGIDYYGPRGWNLGHWNVMQYDISEDETGRLRVDGDALVCFHFSGFDRKRPTRLSKWDKRTPLIKHALLLRLAGDYADALQAAHDRIPARTSRPFAILSDGTRISPLWREAVRVGHRLLADVANPFDVESNPRLKAWFRKAAIDVLDSRKDWQHEGLKELGKRVQAVPGLGYLYRLARAAIEQYR
jgi:hypothetical protein